ncbi:AraC family transcriptional regulator [Nitratireductor sp.]|uniref:AraC family transcriptional regulator n=1 Tax=Nitratireductor sp. TaxID=1872084 RepID=UPI0025EFD352|nr:AraC family transcriptional regulator [Nitratireductor sp.]
MVIAREEWGDRPLSSHALFQTDDLDCAREKVARKFCNHRLEVVGGGRFRAVQNHQPGLLVSLNYISYGADVLIDPGALETFYLIQIPISGCATIKHNRNEFLSDGDRAALLNADRETSMRWWAGCEQVLVQIPKASFMGFAEQLCERPLPGPVVFDPVIDFTRPELASWRNLVNAMFCAANKPEKQVLNLCAAFHEQRILEALLRLQPHNLSAFFDTKQEAAPRQVKRADAFIRENAHRPITLTDIAAASGVGARALQLAYKRTHGMSPMHALTLERLRRVRFDLENAQGEISVTETALRWGFTHLGRFAADYRKTFGERPSETARRATY